MTIKSRYSNTGHITLTDRFGRVFSYLRVALCEQCNLRCIYCMPEKGIDFANRDRLLRREEIIRLIRILLPAGVIKIRYTGGEPLLRKDTIDIIRDTVALSGIKSVHITTNGLLLLDKLAELKDAGLHGINISLDTFDEKKFNKIARRPGLAKVIKSLKTALDMGFDSVKVNMVVMRKHNDDELRDFAELTKNHPITVRFIELMPFDAHQIWKTGHFMGVEMMLTRFYEYYPELIPAEGSATEQYVFRIPGYKGKLALIPSYTRSICGDCSRIRLTADGRIRNCLYAEDELNLIPLLRNGADDDELLRFFRSAMLAKPIDGWAAQRKPVDKHRNSMTQIGG